MIARMIERQILDRLTEALDSAPAVALLGPRQVGKTTLALEIAAGRPSIYLDLESSADRARLADPEAYLGARRHELVILDEVHRAPDLFRPLRGLIDRGRREGRTAGRFLLPGGGARMILAPRTPAARQASVRRSTDHPDPEGPPESLPVPR